MAPTSDTPVTDDTDALLVMVRKDCENLGAVLSLPHTPFQLEQAVNYLTVTIPRTLDSLTAELERNQRALVIQRKAWERNIREREAAETELEQLRQGGIIGPATLVELERVRAERDQVILNYDERQKQTMQYASEARNAEARLDKALAALRRIESGAESNPANAAAEVARFAITEIEGS